MSGKLLAACIKILARGVRHYYHRDKEETEDVLFWELRHGAAGSRHKTFVELLAEDTGRDSVTEMHTTVSH